MADKAAKLLKSMKQSAPKVIPIATDMVLPNNSGDHVKSIKRNTPLKDEDLVNKKYVDDNAVSHWDRTGTNVHLKTSTDKVGIGTASPTGPLHMKSTGALDLYLESETDSTGWTFLANSDNPRAGWQIYTNAADDMKFWHSSDLMTIDSDGNVGIGTASPSSKLEIKEVANTAGYLTIDTTTANYDAGIIIQEANANKWLIRNDASSNTLSFYDYSITKDALSILQGGNVGIGTKSPDTALHILKAENSDAILNLEGTGTAGTFLQFEETGAKKWLIGIDNDTSVFAIRENTVTGDLGMSIDAASTVHFPGNVGIGVTDPHSKLEVNGAISSGQVNNLTASTDALNVASVNSVAINPLSGSITIGGLANGVLGQVVHLFKNYSPNSVIIEHNEASGTQKILTPDNADITLTNYGGVTLVYNRGYWFVISQ